MGRNIIIESEMGEMEVWITYRYHIIFLTQWFLGDLNGISKMQFFCFPILPMIMSL